MASFFKMSQGKPGKAETSISPQAQSAAKSGSGGGSSKLPSCSHTVGATGDHVPGSSGSNSGLPKATTKVGATGDNAAK